MTEREVFERFVPEAAIDYCLGFYHSLDFEFQIKKSRKTKMGDFRWDGLTGKYTITINNDLNPYAFLVTYLHEIAHLVTFRTHGKKVKPHGREWKENFIEIARPVLTRQVFPNQVLVSLNRYFKNPAASSCSDPGLYQALRNFDSGEVITLNQIPIGQEFTFNERTFRKLEKKRTRSVCLDLANNRKYLISEWATIGHIDNN